ncbi:hypothetical protein [Psychromonas sp. MME2]|uniref:YfaP family protein n=1 Tax=Psychromonas sp. MME2 TaxID=3231033 RepID=UPI00339C96B7
MKNRSILASLIPLLVMGGCGGSSNSTPEPSSTNVGPLLETISAKQIESGETFSYQLVVTDPDDTFPADFTFEIIEGPDGLSINENGLLTFTSSASGTKNNSITIQVKDGGENNAQPSRVTFSLDELYYLNISGKLINYYNNQDIADGEVKLSINGTVIDESVSQSNGEYSLRYLDTLTDLRNVVISADAPAYSEASIRIVPSEIVHPNNLYLPPIHSVATFNATEGTVVQFEAASISVSENSFVDENGNLASGVITSELFIIDPTLDIDLMPGEMVTASADNPTQLIPIESFGAISATFTNEDGKILQLKEGKTAEIHIPVSGLNPPNIIPLYYYDDVNGIWVEEGATLVNDVTGNYYLGNVSHFTTWNADRIYDTVNILGCVEDIDGTRIANARIDTEGHDYNGRSNAYSNVIGDFIVPVKSNSTMFVSANNLHQSRTLKVITSSSDFTLSECLILDKATSKIELKWGEAPDDLDSHLYGPNGDGGRFHISFYNESEVVGGSTIYLDVDDTNSYGPEVITIPEYNVPGTYQYYVHNYSGLPNIKPLETRVELIINEERTLFTPPEGVAQEWWHVFDVEVQESGVITVNTINAWSTEPGDSISEAIAPRSLLVKPSIAESQLKSKYYIK